MSAYWLPRATCVQKEGVTLQHLLTGADPLIGRVFDWSSRGAEFARPPDARGTQVRPKAGG